MFTLSWWSSVTESEIRLNVPSPPWRVNLPGMIPGNEIP